jgi:hypothetical protein
MGEKLNESTRIFYRHVRLGGYELTRELVIKTDVLPATKISIPKATLDVDGWMRAEPGFRWDGASGAADTKNFMRGSCSHDVLCDMHQLEQPMPKDWNPKALSLLNRLCREDGMWPARRWWVRQAVRKGCHARPRDINRYMTEHVAP